VLVQAETILNQDSTNIEAKTCKAVSLIQLNQLKLAEQYLAQIDPIVKNNACLAYAKVYLSFLNQKYKDCIDQIQKYAYLSIIPASSSATT